MSSSQHTISDAADAARALRTAERARASANTPEPTASWWAPVAAVTNGSGIALVCGPWTYEPHGARWLFAVGFAALAVFPLMCVVRVRRMKVIAWPPPGTLRQRTVVEFAPVVAYTTGWLAYLAFGQAVGAVTAGILSGIALWWREIRKNGYIAQAEAKLAAVEQTV